MTAPMPFVRPKPTFPVLQRAHPLAKGLIGAWLFTDAGASSTANVVWKVNDWSGAGNDGLSTSDTPPGLHLEWTDGVFGRAGVFKNFSTTNTTTVAVPRNNSVSLDAALYAGEFTVAAWVRQDGLSVDGSLAYIFCKPYDGSNEPMTLRVSGSANVEFSTFNAGMSYFAVGDKLSITATDGNYPGTWIFVVGTISVKTATVSLYTWSASVGWNSASTSITGSLFGSNTNNFLIGNSGTSAANRNWNGLIDNIMVWNRALSATDARALLHDAYEMFRAPSIVGALPFRGTPPDRSSVWKPHSFGTIAAGVGYEHVVQALDARATYVLSVDTSALQNGELVEIRVYNRVGGQYALVHKQTFGPSANPDKETPPLAVTRGAKFSIKQLNGSARSFPWKLRYYQGEAINVSGSTNLRKGLVGFWEMENTSWTDSSGNGLTMTGNGTPTVTAGIVGNALGVLNGSTQFLSHVDDPLLQLNAGGSWSISAWYKGASGGSDFCIVSKNTAGFANREYGVGIGFTSKKVFQAGIYQDSGSLHFIIDPVTDAGDGNWHHVVATWDGTNLCLYVDGRLAAALNKSGIGNPLSSSASTFYIGKDGDGGSILNGSLDQVGVWKGRALSSDDVAALYNNGAARSYAQMT